MEKEFWNTQPAAAGGKRASGVFAPKSKINVDKKMMPIISRSEKLKNFKYLA